MRSHKGQRAKRRRRTRTSGRQADESEQDPISAATASRKRKRKRDGTRNTESSADELVDESEHGEGSDEEETEEQVADYNDDWARTVASAYLAVVSFL